MKRKREASSLVWSGNEFTHSELRGFASEGLFSFLPSPIILHGGAEGKALLVQSVLATSGCVYSYVNVSDVESTRELFGALLEGLCWSVMSRFSEQFQLNGFFERVCSPTRGRAGWLAGATLASWCGGLILDAFLETLAPRSFLDNDSGDATRLARASLVGALPASRVDTPREFATALGLLSSLTVEDLTTKPGCELDDSSSSTLKGSSSPIGLWCVLDGADRLASTLPALIPFLVSIRHHAAVPTLSMVLLADCGLPLEESLRGIPRNAAGGGGCPIYLPWHPPTREAVQEGLESRPPPLLHNHQSSPFSSKLERDRLYKDFLKRIRGSLEGVLGWRDAGECFLAVDTLWPIFCEPLRGRLDERGASSSVTALTPIDPQTLHRLCLPALESFKMGLLSRTSPALTSKPTGSQRRVLSSPSPASHPHVAAQVSTSARDVESCPFFTRLLVCAAFCAGHNPPSTDPRYFSRGTSGKKKVVGAGGLGVGRKLVTGDGPFTFSIDRLLAIANTLSCSLCGPQETREIPYARVYGDCVRDLERMQLLVRCTGGGRPGRAQNGRLGGGVSSLYFTSLVSPDIAFATANTLEGRQASKEPLNLAHYIHDFTIG